MKKIPLKSLSAVMEALRDGVDVFAQYTSGVPRKVVLAYSRKTRQARAYVQVESVYMRVWDSAFRPVSRGSYYALV